MKSEMVHQYPSLVKTIHRIRFELEGVYLENSSLVDCIHSFTFSGIIVVLAEQRRIFARRM